MLIYHITTRSAWETAQTTGTYTAPSLAAEGFIHASTAEQVAGTANLLFKGQPGLVLLCLEVEKLLPKLRYELAPGTDQKFPHIYGPLNLDAVVMVLDFAPAADGAFHFPLS